jgi:hypothetical protein
MRAFLPGLCLGLLLFTYGCGSGRPALVKVSGKVTLDGQPLSDAQVAFQPITTDDDKFQRPSSAMTDASGQFVPQTYEEGDGLRVGKYRVAILKQELVSQIPTGMTMEQAQQLRLRYKWITPRAVSTPEGSGIEIEVTSAGMKPDLIALESVKPTEVD